MLQQIEKLRGWQRFDQQQNIKNCIGSCWKYSKKRDQKVDSNARKITRELTGDPNAIVKQHVIANFMKRYNLKRRKIQRNKRLPKEQYRNLIEKWHSTLRERGIRTSATDPNNHQKWRSFLPHQRLNVDQSSLLFACETTMTYEEIQPRY